MLEDNKHNRVPASVGYSGFVNARDRTMELSLEPSDKPYVLLPSMFEPGAACGGTAGWEGSFKIEVCPEHPVELRAVSGASDWTEKYHNSRWAVDSAGGCRNGSTWKENPTYTLTCTAAMHVAIRISQVWDDGSPAIGFYVLQRGSQIAATSTFRSAEGNVLELDLPQSEADAPYEIIPVRAPSLSATLGLFFIAIDARRCNLPQIHHKGDLSVAEKLVSKWAGD